MNGLEGLMVIPVRVLKEIVIDYLCENLNSVMVSYFSPTFKVTEGKLLLFGEFG